MVAIILIPLKAYVVLLIFLNKVYQMLVFELRVTLTKIEAEYNAIDLFVYYHRFLLCGVFLPVEGIL
jgi:uncharacterized radical SAM superfamily protein